MKLLTMGCKLLAFRYLHADVLEINKGGQRRQLFWGWVIPAVLLLAAFTTRSGAQITILHNFGDGSVPGDGWSPTAAVMQGPDGNFYGTTYESPSVNGTVFEMTPSGTETLLYTFTFGTYGPACNLLYYNGNLIGTTELGGVSGGQNGSYGTVFATSLSGTTTLWHEFHNGSVPHDGWDPYAGVSLGSDGFLYGTTRAGGIYNKGTIYKIDPTNQKLTVVHSFSGSGYGPWASLILANDGNYYGTTTLSTTVVKDGYIMGGIFKMTPKGEVSFLYKFKTTGPAGYLPYAPPIQATDGNFYGTAVGGGRIP